MGDLYFVPSGHSDHLNCHHLFHYHIHPEQAKTSQPSTSLSKISQNVNCQIVSSHIHYFLKTYSSRMCNVQWDLYNIIVKICHAAIVFSVNDSIHDPHQNPKSKA